ncbi:unnamed protein product [Protopolystoma xenopodis]|uniref:Uncharacterized protein n=1 Tax=Protopolystoma xenopodis TaxID=117903 RepID=A0A3S5AQ43_9PLAT|nr:unnamed protein product [Protopolystoma xenopodis]
MNVHNWVVVATTNGHKRLMRGRVCLVFVPPPASDHQPSTCKCPCHAEELGQLDLGYKTTPGIGAVQSTSGLSPSTSDSLTVPAAATVATRTETRTNPASPPASTVRNQPTAPSRIGPTSLTSQLPPLRQSAHSSAAIAKSALLDVSSPAIRIAQLATTRQAPIQPLVSTDVVTVSSQQPASGAGGTNSQRGVRRGTSLREAEGISCTPLTAGLGPTKSTDEPKLRQPRAYQRQTQVFNFDLE